MEDPNPQVRRHGESFLTPGSFIRAARAAHPAFRYALTVAGIAAIVVTFRQFGISYATLVFGTIAVIGLMALFLIFAQASRLAKAKMDVMALVFVWSVLLISILTIIFLAASAFFNWPLPFRDLLISSVSAPADVAPSVVPQSTSAGTNLEPATEPSPPSQDQASAAVGEGVTPQQKALIVADILNAYRAVGWQLAAFDNWGLPPARSTLRVKDQSLSVTFPDGRVVSMSVDPDQLPIPQYYSSNRDVVESLGVDVAPAVINFFTTYAQYKSTLVHLNKDPSDFLSAFTVVNGTARDAVVRGREALCALDQEPPRLFPGGGMMEPVPVTCSDSPFPAA